MRKVRHVLIGAMLGLWGLVPTVQAEWFLWWDYGSVIEEIQDRGVLRVGFGGPFYSYHMCAEGGETIGLMPDVAKRLADTLGVELEIVRVDWNYVFSELETEQFDLIPTLGIIPSRAERINYTIPIAPLPNYLIVNTTVASTIESPADINTSTFIFGEQRNVASIEVLQDLFPEAQLQLYENQPDQQAALIAGEIHGIIGRDVEYNDLKRRYPDLIAKPLEQPLYGSLMGMGLRKGDPDAVNFLNVWISHELALGWLPKTVEYWFNGTTWWDQLETDPEALRACEDSFR